MCNDMPYKYNKKNKNYFYKNNNDKFIKKNICL